MLFTSRAPGAVLAGGSSQVGCPQDVNLMGDAGGRRFEGIGVVEGGGATSVLLKDYPEPQRSQILDLVYKPKFGASVSALMVEVPGDGNSTQGSMPSHMHTRGDLNYSRGYAWWILTEAKMRNPLLSLDANVWSAPGWVGGGKFWSQDAANYDLKWLEGLRGIYGLQLDAIGCRNEKGANYDFPVMLRATLDSHGFSHVKIHAFDNWPSNSLSFVKDMQADEKLRDSIDIVSAHTFMRFPVSPELQAMAARMKKPIWNTEEHVYLKGYDCAINIVRAFNENFIRSGATRIVNWYGIAGLYPTEPYSETPAMLLARSPWSGHFDVREALWGYAHYGQFSEVGWQYLNGGCGNLKEGGSFVTLKSPGEDYSIILETKDARITQQVRFQVGGGLSSRDLCVWRSDTKEQFVRQANLSPVDGEFTISLKPDSIYSLSTTRGQQKGFFDNIPPAKPFPFPYRETFDEYTNPAEWGFLPRYTADIDGAFEISDRPDGKGKCLRQTVPFRPISWAPDWQPYTILGADSWSNYEVSADVYLNPGDSAGVMGRIVDVGPGFRSVPKGYFLTLGDNGLCRLVVVRGLIKTPHQKLEGDAEQRALIRAQNEAGTGGELELGDVQLSNIRPDEWHKLKLEFDGSIISGFVDGKLALTATNRLYSHGMAGLLAGGGKQRFSMPFYKNVVITVPDASNPGPATLLPGQTPIYLAKRAKAL